MSKATIQHPLSLMATSINLRYYVGFDDECQFHCFDDECEARAECEHCDKCRAVFVQKAFFRIGIPLPATPAHRAPFPTLNTMATACSPYKAGFFSGTGVGACTFCVFCHFSGAGTSQCHPVQRWLQGRTQQFACKPLAQTLNTKITLNHKI